MMAMQGGGYPPPMPDNGRIRGTLSTGCPLATKRGLALWGTRGPPSQWGVRSRRMR
jgi:hypothetical protein